MDADARFWDRIAEDYARRPFPKPEATARKLALTRSLLRPGDRLLDLGCGTGTILLELAPAVAHAEGVDVSGEMIRIAREKATAAGAQGVQFHVAPAGHLEGFADASYDCVCAYNLLHLVPDPGSLLQAIARVLKPGGVLVSSTVCLGGSWLPPYALILPIMRWLGKAPAVTLLRAAELHRLVAAAGFPSIETPDVGDAAPGVFLIARTSAP